MLGTRDGARLAYLSSPRRRCRNRTRRELFSLLRTERVPVATPSPVAIVCDGFGLRPRSSGDARWTD